MRIGNLGICIGQGEIRRDLYIRLGFEWNVSGTILLFRLQMDALILEMNKLSCYDMIDHFCDHIMSRLSFLEKKR